MVNCGPVGTCDAGPVQNLRLRADVPSPMRLEFVQTGGRKA